MSLYLRILVGAITDNARLIWIGNAPSNHSIILVTVARITLCSFYEIARREAPNICLHESFLVYIECNRSSLAVEIITVDQ